MRLKIKTCVTLYLSSRRRFFLSIQLELTPEEFIFLNTVSARIIFCTGKQDRVDIIYSVAWTFRVVYYEILRKLKLGAYCSMILRTCMVSKVELND